MADLQVFGSWTVLRPSGRKWSCQCVCGTVRDVPPFDLRAGKSTNCGCVAKVARAAAAKRANTKHGMQDTPEYRSWVEMRRRCRAEHRREYPRWGGRGIKVCERWDSPEGFQNFLSDMGARPPGHSLDRVDNDGNYEPSNCRWATRSEQGRNMRSNRMLTVYGARMTVVEASERYGISANAILLRLARGWTEDDAATRPARIVKRGL